jgi:hypothetical protein
MCQTILKLSFKNAQNKKEVYFTCIRSKKCFKNIDKNLAKNVALLICKSLFHITIIYSDIPYKCSHVVDNENLKIFYFNYFCIS